MPFRKPDNKNNTSSKPVREIFIGRTNEINFFIQQILKPTTPDYNIVSISGQGGVGKSTLLERFQKESQAAEFKDFCLPIFVNERQITPVAIMEQFAGQLEKAGHPLVELEKKLADYKEVLRKLRDEREAGRDAFLQGGMDMVGSVVEGVPVAGKFLASESKTALNYVLEQRRNRQQQKDAELLENSLQELTATFVQNTSKIADNYVKLSYGTRRNFRILLFFDTYEQLAEEITPWLLDYFLPTEDISPNIILIIAGRDDVKQIGNDPKKWLPYNEIIYPVCLDCFTKDETVAYLAERNITEPEKVETIWELSKGLPLYLGFLTSNPNADIDPTKDVIDNFLRWEKDETKRRLALEASLFSRPFNQDDLSAFSYIAETDRPAIYRWLIGLPFVRSHNLLDGRHLYHDVAQEMFSRHLFQTSPINCYATRRDLAEYYKQQLKQLEANEGEEAYQNPEWLELSLALAYQLLLLPDSQSHIKAIEVILFGPKIIKKDYREGIVKFLQDFAHKKANNSVKSQAYQIIRHLECYVNSDYTKLSSLESTDFILKKVERFTNFSTRVLARLYRTRGALHRELDKNFEKALADGTKSIQLDSQNETVFAQRGETYLTLQNYQEAIIDFTKAVELNPNYTQALALRGECYFLEGLYKRSISDFNRAIEINPNYVWALFQRSQYHKLFKNYDKALLDLNLVIKLYPDTWYYYKRGELFFLNGKNEEAIKDFDKSIEIYPENPWAFASRGEVYRKVKQLNKAIEDFNEAIKSLTISDYVELDLGQVLIQRAIAYRENRQFQDAIEVFNDSIKYQEEEAHEPVNGFLYAERGETYRLMKAYSKALDDFTTAINLYIDYFAYEEYEDSRHNDYLKQILPNDELDFRDLLFANSHQADKTDLSYKRIYSNRANTYLNVRCLEEAKRDFAQSWELDKNDINDGWMAEWVKMCLQQPDAEIITNLEEIAAIDPTDIIAYICRSVAALLKQDYQAASAELDKCIELEPKDNWDGYFWKGMALAYLGNDAEAAENSKKALKLEMPPVLMLPLKWLEQDRPEFYQKYALPLLQQYDLI